MPNVSLYAKFAYTDGRGNTYSDGSTTTAVTVAAGTDEVFDRTYSIGSTTIKEIWSDTLMGDFDFLWIESNVDAEIQLVCNEGGLYDGGSPGLENGFCLKLKAGIPFYLSTDDSRNRGNVAGTFNASNYASEQNTWESDWTTDTIDRIEFYASGAALVRVFAVT
tara:strand:- start:1141 stop:1632 length:492 start_codon:yes stop_codon:yes gene_type:complete